MKYLHFQIKPDITVIKFIQAISDKYSVKKIKSEKIQIKYMDTFDWRFYRNNYCLSHSNNVITLTKLIKQGLESNLIVDNVPVFAADFPKGILKNTIGKIIQYRAIIPVAEKLFYRNIYNILDDNKKIIIKLQIDSFPRIGKFILIKALRGYEHHLGFLNSQIKGYVEVTDQKVIFDKILENNKKFPDDYDPRIKVQLQPMMRSDQAIKIILNKLVNTMMRNEKGIIDDIDTEFLHDYRVASRRTRAALSQIKDVFDPQLTEKFNNQFTLLGKKTNKLRDLDVYLLNKDKYINRLPEKMQADIYPFFNELKNERDLEIEKFVRFLKSVGYKNQLKNYVKFISGKSEKNNVAINASRPIKPLAIELLKKRYYKIIYSGNKISADSPDKMYHKIRIQCKKFRYLLEFFGSLFPQNKIDLLIVQLKKLQDNLGIFNDLSMQQETLKNYSQNKIFNTNVILALGYLVGKLNDEQIIARNEFETTFKAFSNKKNKKLFSELIITNKG